MQDIGMSDKEQQIDVQKEAGKSEDKNNTFPVAGRAVAVDDGAVKGDSNPVDSNSVNVAFSNKSPQGFDPTDEYWRLFAFRKDEDKHLWRKQYLQKSFYLVGFALYFSFFILMMVGVGLVDLSTTVLVTLLGSTVAEVIGILIVAFNWLYPNTANVVKEVKE